MVYRRIENKAVILSKYNKTNLYKIKNVPVEKIRESILPKKS